MSRKCFWDRYWDAPVSYWSVFPLSQVTAPEVFVKVNSAQFPSRSLSAELVITIHSINLLLSCHTIGFTRVDGDSLSEVFK